MPIAALVEEGENESGETICTIRMVVGPTPFGTPATPHSEFFLLPEPGRGWIALQGGSEGDERPVSFVRAGEALPTDQTAVPVSAYLYVPALPERLGKLAAATASGEPLPVDLPGDLAGALDWLGGRLADDWRSVWPNRKRRPALRTLRRELLRRIASGALSPDTLPPSFAADADYVLRFLYLPEWAAPVERYDPDFDPEAVEDFFSSNDFDPDDPDTWPEERERRPTGDPALSIEGRRDSSHLVAWWKEWLATVDPAELCAAPSGGAAG